MDLKQHVRTYENFPKDGILYYDVGSLTEDPKVWQQTIKQLADHIRSLNVDFMLGIESRGFLLSAPLSVELDMGFSMIRKAGKLPGELESYSYDLEYGSDTVEIQRDVIQAGTRVVIVDDLLATGGTMTAATRLVESIGGEVVECTFIMELDGLGGRQAVDRPCHALMSFPA